MKKEKLTWYNEISNFCVAFCKWIENPPTRHEISFVCEIVDIRIRVEAVDPESEFLKLSSIEPRVHLKPVGSDEASCDEDNHNKPEAQGNIAGEGPLPVGVGVGEQIISHPHVYVY